MPLRDRLLALFVAVCWGINFPATALALQHFPPLLLGAVRFSLLAVPAILFVPRPQIPVRWLIGTGFGLGFLQFGFLYLGMAAGMPSGLASLVLQASAPFTVVLAGFWLRERLSWRQVIGIAVSVIGIGVIAAHRSQVAALMPVVLTLCGALGWAFGNVCARRAKAPNPLQLTMWMSVVPPIPLLGLSFAVEGPRRIGDSLSTVFTSAALPAVIGLVYIVLVSTVVGYGIWNTLLSRHPSSVVAPFSMLVPVVGVAASWVAFGQTVDLIEVSAGIAVIAGVLLGSRPSRVGKRVEPDHSLALAPTR
ncbi:O-acetylserine/cysteine efflux transporter [Nakamurella sp. UYEF19]|uniref:EamA family transporter n=1 Tax=Nakamurella sp. UYEF19 TaxID=1756392 RepID=UPI0033989D75